MSKVDVEVANKGCNVSLAGRLQQEGRGEVERIHAT